MTTLDPTTGAPLPPDAIQRILFIASPVHIYSIPPLTTTRGHLASHWTSSSPSAPSRQIFTARLRILETAIPSSSPSPTLSSPSPSSSPDDSSPASTITTHILLEDPTTGDLFASAPYTLPSAVEQVLDSSRFFAIRVVSPDGAQKAVLGIGFEERSTAFDFSIALQEVRKVQSSSSSPDAPPSSRIARDAKAAAEQPVRDFSLPPGQTIHVDVGRHKGRRPLRRGEEEEEKEKEKEKGKGGAEADDRALFSIAPPPPYERGGVLAAPPPQSSSTSARATEGKAERRRSRTPEPGTRATAADLGFDDGEFGEFQ